MRPRGRVDEARRLTSDNLTTLRGLTRLLDEAVEIPGLGVKVGLDALIGLIPGAGDIAGGVMGFYGLIVAHRLGAPPSVLAHMLLNIGIDSLVGVVPVLGDLFDAGWKSNSKNLRLIEGYLGQPRAASRGSLGILVIALAAVIAMIVGSVWLAIVVFRFLAGLAT
jgi:hypothetical protein